MANKKQRPIQINPDQDLRKKIEEQARAEDRKLGPMVLVILRQHYAGKS